MLPHLILYLKPHGNFYVTVESVSIYELFKSAHAVLDFVLLVHFVLKPFAGRTFAWASLIEPQNGLSFTSNCCYYEYCLQFCFLFGYAVRTSTISVQIKTVLKTDVYDLTVTVISHFIGWCICFMKLLIVGSDISIKNSYYDNINQAMSKLKTHVRCLATFLTF